MINGKLKQVEINAIYVVIGELQGIASGLANKSISDELIDLSDRLEGIVSEETTVLELPCKVGDILYVPVIDENVNESFIDECTVNDISTKRIFISCKNPPGDDCDDNYLIDELGKTIFLTKDEAEQVLKELKENES